MTIGTNSFTQEQINKMKKDSKIIEMVKVPCEPFGKNDYIMISKREHNTNIHISASINTWFHDCK